MDTQQNYQWLHAEGTTPIKGWVNGVPLEAQAHEQLRNIALSTTVTLLVPAERLQILGPRGIEVAGAQRGRMRDQFDAGHHVDARLAETKADAAGNAKALAQVQGSIRALQEEINRRGPAR